jgi:hypothetical protein
MPWKRSELALACGSHDGCTVQKGEPYYVTAQGRIRCQRHAELLFGPVPADLGVAGSGSQGERATSKHALAPLPDPAAIGFSSLRPLAAQAQVDWARRAAGEKDE